MALQDRLACGAKRIVYEVRRKARRGSVRYVEEVPLNNVASIRYVVVSRSYVVDVQCLDRVVE